MQISSKRFVLRTEQQREWLLELIAKLPLEPTFVIEIEKYKRNRTGSQNRLWWAWIRDFARDVGMDPNDLHEEMKSRILGVEGYVDLEGKPANRTRSTTDLDTGEFNEALDRLQSLAAEYGTLLAYPDELSQR